MANIGTLGNVVFEVSSELIRTFDDYTRKSTARLAAHEIIGQKPVLEFLGPAIEEISITIKLSAFCGVSPEKEANELRRICETGEIVNFIINGTPVSTNKWLIESVEEAAKAYDSKGNILTAEVRLVLKEYVIGEIRDADI